MTGFTDRRRLGEGRKAFFFEKKNQKTFIPGGDTQNSGLNDTFGAKFKSFLLLFFKKEDFLPLIAFLPTWAVTKKEPKNSYFTEMHRLPFNRKDRSGAMHRSTYTAGIGRMAKSLGRCT